MKINQIKHVQKNFVIKTIVHHYTTLLEHGDFPNMWHLSQQVVLLAQSRQTIDFQTPFQR